MDLDTHYGTDITYIEEMINRYEILYFNKCIKKIEIENNEIESEIYIAYLEKYINKNMTKFIEYIIKNNNNEEICIWNFWITKCYDIETLSKFLIKLEKYIRNKEYKFIVLKKLLSCINKQSMLTNLINDWKVECQNGKDYEELSMLSFFSLNDLVITNETHINTMLETFRMLYKSEFINIDIIYNLLYNSLMANIKMTHMNININAKLKCSSTNFLISLMYMCVDISNGYDFRRPMNIFKYDRSDFKLYAGDDETTKIFYTLNLCIYIYMIVLLDNKNVLTHQLHHNNKRKSYYEDKLYIIESTLLNSNINNTILGLYENMAEILEININNNILIEPITFSLENVLRNMIDEYNIKCYDKQIYNLLEGIISGSYTTNPHIRQQCITLYHSLTFTPKTFTSKSINSIMLYYNNVDYKEWSSFDDADRHSIEIYNFMLKYSSLYKGKLELNCVLRTFIYKLCSDGLSDYDIFNEFCVYINKQMGTLNQSSPIYKQNLNQIIIINKDICNKFKKNNIAVLILYYILIKSNFVDFPKEIITQMLIYLLNMTKICLDKHLNKANSSYVGVKAIYKNIINMFNNMLSYNKKKINNIIYNIYNTGSNESNDLLYDVPVLNNFIDNYDISYSEDNDRNVDYPDDIDFPDEFIDPLTCVSIEDPIMIPNVNSVFDKSSIITHLYSSKTNPFTREILTEKDVEEYNLKPDVIEKVKQFIINKNIFIDTYIEKKNENN